MIRGAPPRNQQLPEWRLGSTVIQSEEAIRNCSVTNNVRPSASTKTISNLQLDSCQSEGGVSDDPVRGDPEVADQSEVSRKQRHQSEVDC